MLCFDIARVFSCDQPSQRPGFCAYSRVHRHGCFTGTHTWWSTPQYTQLWNTAYTRNPPSSTNGIRASAWVVRIRGIPGVPHVCRLQRCAMSPRRASEHLSTFEMCCQPPSVASARELRVEPKVSLIHPSSIGLGNERALRTFAYGYRVVRGGRLVRCSGDILADPQISMPILHGLPASGACDEQSPANT